MPVLEQAMTADPDNARAYYLKGFGHIKVGSQPAPPGLMRPGPSSTLGIEGEPESGLEYI
jgi:hypothetical protein